MPLHQSRDHLVAQIGQVKLEDREAEYRRLRSRCRSAGRPAATLPDRHRNERFLAGKQVSYFRQAVRAEFLQRIFEVRPPFLERRGPQARLEHMRLGIPAAKAQRALFGVDEMNARYDSWVFSLRHPGRVAP